VTMSCSTSEQGHKVSIFASNSANANAQCDARCYYRTDQGNDGNLHGSGTVPAHAKKVEFASSTDTTRTFTVTKPVSYTCN
jgi:hypothetical protein